MRDDERKGVGRGEVMWQSVGTVFGWFLLPASLPARFLLCVTYGGGVKCLHIERRITGAFHPHPPSHVARKHAPG